MHRGLDLALQGRKADSACAAQALVANWLSGVGHMIYDINSPLFRSFLASGGGGSHSTATR